MRSPTCQWPAKQQPVQVFLYLYIQTKPEIWIHIQSFYLIQTCNLKEVICFYLHYFCTIMLLFLASKLDSHGQTVKLYILGTESYKMSDKRG